MPKVVITIDIDVIEEETIDSPGPQDYDSTVWRDDEFISAREYMEIIGMSACANIVGKDLTQRCRKHGFPIKKEGGLNKYPRSGILNS